jgi:hypothetical protein
VALEIHSNSISLWVISRSYRCVRQKTLDPAIKDNVTSFVSFISHIVVIYFLCLSYQFMIFVCAVPLHLDLFKSGKNWLRYKHITILNSFSYLSLLLWWVSLLIRPLCGHKCKSTPTPSTHTPDHIATPAITLQLLQHSATHCDLCNICNTMTIAMSCHDILQHLDVLWCFVILSPDMPTVLCFICDLILNVWDMCSLSHWFWSSCYTPFRCILSPQTFLV